MCLLTISISILYSTPYIMMFVDVGAVVILFSLHLCLIVGGACRNWWWGALAYVLFTLYFYLIFGGACRNWCCGALASVLFSQSPPHTLGWTSWGCSTAAGSAKGMSTRCTLYSVHNAYRTGITHNYGWIFQLIK